MTWQCTGFGSHDTATSSLVPHSVHIVLFFVTASDHKDSVTCTGFSHDGKYVATADMGGLVQVWLTSSGEKVWSFETGDIEVNTDIGTLYSLVLRLSPSIFFYTHNLFICEIMYLIMCVNKLVRMGLILQ